MKLTTLRYLDKNVWWLACIFFSVAKKIFIRKKSKQDLLSLKPKKILLIKLWWIGSVILMSPVFKNLREIYPDAEIHFLTKKWIDKIYTDWVFDKVYSLNTWWILNAIKDFIYVPFALFRERYDLVIDFEVVSNYTAALTFLLFPRYSIGYQIIGKIKDKMYDYNVMYHESKHITDIFLLPLKLLWKQELSYDLIWPSFSAKDKDIIYNDFPNINKCVAVNVNASNLALERRWIKEYIIETIDFLTNNGYEILLVWSPDEQDYVSEVYDLVKKNINLIHNIAWKYSLTQTFAILKQVKLFITNDSWPLHVAIAYNTPTVSFFGPETPVIYWPKLDKWIHKTFFLNLYCSPCISVFRDKNFICGNENNCMKLIKPDVVIEYIKSFLKI